MDHVTAVDMPERLAAFEALEAVALSGQMSEADLIRIIDGDPDFAHWWRDRAALRSQPVTYADCLDD